MARYATMKHATLDSAKIMPTIKLSVKWVGSRPVIQEQQDVDRPEANHQTRKAGGWTGAPGSFESQLRSAYQTSYTGTQTVPSSTLLIASSIPRDDSVHWIPELRVSVAFEPGEEGAEIVIEPIP